MITLTANIILNTQGFKLGESKIKTASFGEGGEIAKAIDKRNIIRLNSSIYDRQENDRPCFGIVSNGGNITFKDDSDVFYKYSEIGWLDEGNEIQPILTNTLTKRKINDGYFTAKEWRYDVDAKQFDVSFSDGLEEWQDIIIEENVYQYGGESLLWYYSFLRDKTPSEFRMVSFSELDEATKNVLKSTIQHYKFTRQQSLWASWTNLCEATGSYIYRDVDGKTKFKYGRGT